MASLTVSGTPVAVPENSPKLERMSLRTTPLSVSTSGPLEPSPGNGPAVSSGMTAQVAPVVAAAPTLAVGLATADGAQAANATTPALKPAYPKSCSARRRSMSVSMSKRRPWSLTSSSGLARGRPWYIGTGTGRVGGGIGSKRSVIGWPPGDAGQPRQDVAAR